MLEIRAQRWRSRRREGHLGAGEQGRHGLKVRGVKALVWGPHWRHKGLGPGLGHEGLGHAHGHREDISQREERLVRGGALRRGRH